MKKLPILENSESQNTRRLKAVSVGVNGEKIPVTWEWEEFFDHTICMSLFEEYRDAVATLDESNIGFDELAKMFLLGCKYGSGKEQADTDAADNHKI
ncbi:hypothetical protein LJC45_00860 [Alistipes sp. OttesenSCG-928-B03]|nr:hypothetical protein [Alistipes sp. OttesenSCG-928-B03]